MANSKVDICNLALALVGERAIISFSDNNNRSRLCDVLYEQARNTVMSLFDWPFARAFEKLQQLDPDVVSLPTGLYGYKVPVGCTFPRALYPKNRSIWFEIQGDMILTKTSGDQYLYYSMVQTDATRFSPLFITSVADLLASWICHPLTGDKKLAELKTQNFLVGMNQNTAVEANKGNEYRRSDEDPNYDKFNYPEAPYGIDEGDWRVQD